LEAELRKARFLLRQTQAEVRRISEATSSVERNVIRDFQRINAAFQSVQTTAQRAGQALLGLASVQTAQAVATQTRRVLEFGDALGDMAEQLDISAESLQRLRFAAQQNGATTDQLDRALAVLNDRLGDAASGSRDAQQAFANLGLRWQDLQGQRVDQVLLVVADALQQFENQSDRAARQAGVLGDRSRALLNFLNLTSEGIQTAARRLDAFGGVISDQAIRALGEANDKLDEFATLLQSRVAIALADLAPQIIRVINRLEDFLFRLEQSGNLLESFSFLGDRAVDTLTDLEQIMDLVDRTTRRVAEAWNTLTSLFGLTAPRSVGALTNEIRLLDQALETLRRTPETAEQLAKIAELTQRRTELIGQRERVPVDIDTSRRFAGGGLEGPEAVTAGLAGFDLARRRRGTNPPFEIPERARNFAQDLEKAMRQIEGFAEAMRLAGQPVDILQDQINALSTNIRNRLEAGVPPASAVIQELTQRLVGLQRQLAENEARLEDLGRQDVLGQWPDATEIVREMEAELRNLDTSIRVFGKSPEDAARRTDILRQALQDAINEGVLPFDTALQRLQRRFEQARAAEAFGVGLARGQAQVAEAVARTEAEYSQLAETLNEQFRLPRQRLQEFQAQVESIPPGLLDERIGTQAIRDAQIEFARTTVLGQGIITIADGITEAFDESFTGIIQGTVSVSDAFKRMAQSILLSISRILIQRGVTTLLNIALAGIAPGATGGAAGTAVAGDVGGFQRGGFVPGRRGAGDIVPAFLSPGEFVVRRQAVEALGAQTLAKINAIGLQQGGPVVPNVANVATAQAPGVTINNIVVRDQREADARRQELEQLDGHIVNVINRQILGGDGTLINRSLTMVRGGR
jgi:hypothetical protein